MPAGPTFASGPVPPGTFVKVVFQTRPPSAPPAFVTALIGRTSGDKPDQIDLVRNQVAAQTVTVDPTTGQISITTGDTDEAIRRDKLLSDDTLLVSIGDDPIVDKEVFQQFLNGFINDWVSTVASSKVYIEWLANYSVKAVSTAPIFMGQAGSGTFIVQLARATADPIFTVAPGPMTIPDGSATFRMVVTGTGTVFNLRMQGPTATGFGTPVPVTAGGEFTITDDGTGGSGGTVKVKVDVAQLTGGAPGTNFPTDTNYDNTVVISTRGPRIGTAIVDTVIAALGSQYTVPFRTVKELADFVPTLFDNQADVENFHGDLTATSRTDDLAVGTLPYFSGGGQSLYLVPLKDQDIVGPTDGFDLDEITGSGYTGAVEAALVQLEDVASVCMIIPLSPTESIAAGNFRPGILNAVLSHVNRMSAVTEAKPRMAMMSARAGTTNEAVFEQAQSQMQSNRIVYVSPSTATLNAEGTSLVVPGTLIACEIAGILSSGVNAGEPISGKHLTGFVDIPDTAFTRTQKNRIGEVFGGTVIEKQGGAPTIRHFLTTNVTSSLLVEAKVTVIEIDIRRSLKSGLDATLINTRLVSGQTIGAVRSIISAILSQKVAVQVLNAFDIIKIQVDPLEPRQLNVDLAVQPVFDLNWIYLTATFTVS